MQLVQWCMYCSNTLLLKVLSIALDEIRNIILLYILMFVIGYKCVYSRTH